MINFIWAFLKNIHSWHKHTHIYIYTHFQVNVTVETVTTVVENLTQVVVTTNETSDQNTDNLKVITNTLTETSRLIKNNNVPLEVINEVSYNNYNCSNNTYIHGNIGHLNLVFFV